MAGAGKRRTVVFLHGKRRYAGRHRHSGRVLCGGGRSLGSVRQDRKGPERGLPALRAAAYSTSCRAQEGEAIRE